ncbi:hypothetical protein OROGR_003481 [Orobanche gracilis]
MDTIPEKQHITPPRSHQVSLKTAVMAFVAGLMIGGPLLGLMAITFAAATTLLVVTSPLFIIFFPVLLCAACVLGLVMFGLATAGIMALAGLSTMAWVFRSYTSRISGGRSEKSIGDVEGEPGKDWTGYIQQKPYYQSGEAGKVLINRA